MRLSRQSSGAAFSDPLGVGDQERSKAVSPSPTSVWRSSTRRILRQQHQWLKSFPDGVPPTDARQPNPSVSDVTLMPPRVPEIEECLRWWARQRPVTLESVNAVWKLWDVLLGHVGATAASTDDEDPSSLPSTFLNLCLDHWRLGLLEGVESELYAVETIWTRLSEEWLPHATAKSFGLVLSAVAAQNRPLETDRPLPFLANDVLEFCLTRGVSPPPDPVLWNSALASWAKATDAAVAPLASEHALALLRRMKSMHVTPNQISYASVLQALSNTASARSHQQSELASQALQLLDEMRLSGLAPNDVCYLNALQTLVRCKRLDLAHDSLKELIQEYQANPFVDGDESLAHCKPTPQMFGAVMAGYARQGNVGQVLALWETLSQLYREDELASSTLQFIMQALAEARTLECAQQAQNLLESICATQSKVDTACYNTVLNAWAECVHHNPRLCVQRAEALLRLVPHPDTISYTSTIKAWARSDLPEAAERCMAFLQAMWDDHRRDPQGQQSSHSVKPNAITYSTVLYAWSRSLQRDAPLQADELFNSMVRLYNEGDLDLKPNEASHVALMTAWNRSTLPQAASRVQFYFDRWKGTCLASNVPLSINFYHLLLHSKRRKGDGITAEQVLNEMLDGCQQSLSTAPKPSPYTFQLVMNAHINSHHAGAAERVESLLRKMEHFHALGWKDCKPTATTFSFVLSALAKSNLPDGPERAEKLIREMMSSSDPEVQPNAHSYAVVLTAWSRSQQPFAPERAQALFDEMLDRFSDGDDECRPNLEACAALLTAWSRSSRPESAAKAFALLLEMEDRHRRDPRHVCPNGIHYSSVINAFAEKGDEPNARAVLEQMLSKKGTLEPHVGCYNAYLKAIVKSGLPDAAERAEAVLRSLPAAGPGRPDAATYTTCIRAWEGTAPLDPTAEERAEALLREMARLAAADPSRKPRVKPTVQAFRAYLGVLSHSETAPTEKAKRADRTVGWMQELGVRPTWEFQKELRQLKLGIAIESQGRRTPRRESPGTKSQGSTVGH